MTSPDAAAGSDSSTGLAFASAGGEKAPLDLLFAGDIHFEWAVLEDQRWGVHAPLSSVLQFFDQANVRVANLETAISDQGKPPPGKPYVFNASPEQVRVLQRLRLDAAILANNHSMDMGAEGMRRSIEVLRSGGIAAVGVGENSAAAAAPLLISRHGQTLALFAFNMINEADTSAAANRPGAAPYSSAMLANVRAASRDVDCTLVSLHWGMEYYLRPTPEQVQIARSLIDAGANVVVGHHSHTPQGVEIYRDGLILYSLGNFLFGSSNEDQSHNLLARLHITPGKGCIARATLIPIWGKFSAQARRPAPLQGAEFRSFAHEFYWLVHDVSPATAAKLAPIEGEGIRLDIQEIAPTSVEPARGN